MSLLCINYTDRLSLDSIIGLIASLRLFRSALKGVLHSPVSFFDTTPMGRILSRLSKDQDTLDTQLSITGYTVSYYANQRLRKLQTYPYISS